MAKRTDGKKQTFEAILPDGSKAQRSSKTFTYEYVIAVDSISHSWPEYKTEQSSWGITSWASSPELAIKALNDARKTWGIAKMIKAEQI